ncbi:protein PXR1-like [Pyrus x bretschneideri]|nr:protein PXR1-like [Pyrus x bretschneideri]
MEEKTQKDEGKEGKEKKDKEKKEKGEKGENKRKVDKKDKCTDVGKLKQKLEKINGKIEALLEKKSDITRQIKEAEGAILTVAEKPTDAA